MPEDWRNDIDELYLSSTMYQARSGMYSRLSSISLTAQRTYKSWTCTNALIAVELNN